MRMMVLAVAAALAVLGGSGAAAQDEFKPRILIIGEPWIVFFPWDKPDIDRDAAAILEEVAKTWRENPHGFLRISGHADRSGGAAHNLRSSRRRAESVADFLVGRGVARDSMAVEAHGEARPIVPTEDGVREPQNRRVEIRFGER